MLLEEKSAVVTGGASGIGADTCRAFAREGARVAVLDRTIEKAEEVCAALPAVDAGEHIALEVDCGSPKSIDAAFAAVDSAFGRVDALVNSAGIRSTASPLDATIEEWQAVVDVNLTGSFYSSKLAARRMAEQGEGGSIVNIASVAGILAVDNRASYCASKAGVIGLTRSLAMDLGELGIRVNAVCPGVTKTGLTAPFFEDSSWVERIAADIPLRRTGEAVELAEVILFLCSDMAAYVSGVALPVDGGMSAVWPLGGTDTAFSADRNA